MYILLLYYVYATATIKILWSIYEKIEFFLIIFQIYFSQYKSVICAFYHVWHYYFIQLDKIGQFWEYSSIFLFPEETYPRLRI